MFNLMNIVFFASRNKWVNAIIAANEYSLLDERVEVILIANKNKTSYDALLDFRFFMLCILCICDAGK